MATAEVLTHKPVLEVIGLTVRFGGITAVDDVTGLEPEDSFALGMVQVPGGRGVFPGLTVKENL